MTDAEIQDKILELFRSDFEDFGGDDLMECLDNDEDAYERAQELLKPAILNIIWEVPKDPNFSAPPGV